MTDNELLLALSTLFDKELKPIEQRLRSIELTLENDIRPRLQNIESCYTSTFNRYKKSVEGMKHQYSQQGGDNMALSTEDLKAIELLLEPIRRDIRSIQLTLENETNRNIKIISEGHLDLNRKLEFHLLH